MLCNVELELVGVGVLAALGGCTPTPIHQLSPWERTSPVVAAQVPTQRPKSGMVVEESGARRGHIRYETSDGATVESWSEEKTAYYCYPKSKTTVLKFWTKTWPNGKPQYYAQGTVEPSLQDGYDGNVIFFSDDGKGCGSGTIAKNARTGIWREYRSDCDPMSKALPKTSATYTLYVTGERATAKDMQECLRSPACWPGLGSEGLSQWAKMPDLTSAVADRVLEAWPSLREPYGELDFVSLPIFREKCKANKPAACLAAAWLELRQDSLSRVDAKSEKPMKPLQISAANSNYDSVRRKSYMDVAADVCVAGLTVGCREFAHEAVSFRLNLKLGSHGSLGKAWLEIKKRPRVLESMEKLCVNGDTSACNYMVDMLERLVHGSGDIVYLGHLDFEDMRAPMDLVLAIGNEAANACSNIPLPGNMDCSVEHGAACEHRAAVHERISSCCDSAHYTPCCQAKRALEKRQIFGAAIAPQERTPSREACFFQCNEMRLSCLNSSSDSIWGGAECGNMYARCALGC